MTDRDYRTNIIALLCAFIAGLTWHAAKADDALAAQLLPLQQAWDAANYDHDAAAREHGLEELSKEMDDFVRAHPGRAEPLIWQGIVLSSYAGAKGGLGALSLAKRARDALLAALEIDPAALQGSAYTSLGALYFKVPRFPIGFGNRGRAAEYLRKALAINPDGIDPNFFYAELLLEEGDRVQARRHLEKALAAPARTDRPLADQGRRAQINALLADSRQPAKR